MRLPLLAVGIALGLAACGDKNQTENTAVVDQNLTADNIVTNDVTAIDAVTADAANMAADVNYETPIDNGADNATDATDTIAPSKSTPKPHPRPAAPRPGSDTPSGNAIANTAGNSTD